MILTSATVETEMKIRKGVKRHAILVDKGKRWKVGGKIDFWRGDPRNTKGKDKPALFGTGIVKEIKHINITHHLQAGQKVGEVYLDGNKIGYDDTYRLASQDGFGSVREFFEHYNYDYKGRLITWKDQQFT